MLDPEHHLHIAIITHPEIDSMDVLVAAELRLVLHNYNRGRLGEQRVATVLRLTEVTCSDSVPRAKHDCALPCSDVESESRPLGKTSTTDISFRNLVGLQSYVDRP